MKSKSTHERSLQQVAVKRLKADIESSSTCGCETILVTVCDIEIAPNGFDIHLDGAQSLMHKQLIKRALTIVANEMGFGVIPVHHQ